MLTNLLLCFLQSFWTDCIPRGVTGWVSSVKEEKRSTHKGKFINDLLAYIIISILTKMGKFSKDSATSNENVKVSGKYWTWHQMLNLPLCLWSIWFSDVRALPSSQSSRCLWKICQITIRSLFPCSLYFFFYCLLKAPMTSDIICCMTRLIALFNITF